MHMIVTTRIEVRQHRGGVLAADLTTQAEGLSADPAWLAAETAPLLQATADRALAALGPAVDVEQTGGAEPHESLAPAVDDRVFVNREDLLEVAYEAVERVTNLVGVIETHAGWPAKAARDEVVADAVDEWLQADKA